MLNWLLILFITLVSTTLLMFVSAYIAIFPQTAAYYSVDRDKIILLSYTFNIFYLIISPLLFPWLKKYFSFIVKAATIIVACGCIGRFLVHDNYIGSMFFSVIVGIAHVPIITAPYGLLGLFQSNQRGYASSIPLFIPVLGINFCILYGMEYIADSIVLLNSNLYIDRLNFIIALVGTISAVGTVILMNMLSTDIRKINQQSQDAQNNRGCLQSLRSQFKNYKQFTFTVLSWGVILGIHWTYGGMFGVFLDGTGLTHKQTALIGLYANLSSAVFCNLGNWISNKFQFSNASIIFYLNILGFLASLFVQASTALPHPIFHNKIALIIDIIILRAGFSSFVSLGLMELSNFGSSVLVSSIFFYIANAMNLIGAYLITIMSNSKSLALMSFIVWLCILFVFIFYKGKRLEVQQLEFQGQEMSSNKAQVYVETEDKGSSSSQL